MTHSTLSPSLTRKGFFSGFLCLITLLLTLSTIQAQVTVRLKMNKKTHLLGEDVKATIFITNHSGRQLTLRGNGVRPWLTFHLESSGRTIPYSRVMNYNALTIPTGQTRARTVSISSSYTLGIQGNYTCSCAVNMPGPTRNGFSSNRVHFTIANGYTSWVQRAGVPGAAGEIREYKLVIFSGNSAVELYAQVSSTNTGRNIATIPLGKIINYRRPTGTLDKANNMHALYQVKPDLFTHVAITPQGKVKFATYYRRGVNGAPRLITLGDGKVRVAGGVPYNAKAEAARRKKIHSASDRPSVIYK